MRNTKTEYVSCPSCGRTLFDLQEVTEQIRTRTGHLPGVSIAVMGCIVNGPGEMADADFGCAHCTLLPFSGQDEERVVVARVLARLMRATSHDAEPCSGQAASARAAWQVPKP